MKKRIFTDEHKKKISQKLKQLKENGYIRYNTGLKTLDRKNGKYLLLKNMQSHLKYNVSIDWLMKFDDIEKLKFLNKSITRKRDCYNFDTVLYIKFIEKFYYDKKFNKIYDSWIKSKDKYLKPSLDHIIPKSKGGKLNDLNNLQFLTWFENRAKCNMSNEEWIKIKENLKDYLL